MGLRSSSRTHAHLPRTGMGSVRLVRRSAPCEYSACVPSLSRSCGRPFLNLRSSSELDHRDPMPFRRLPGMSNDTSSPGLSLPFDTCRLCGCGCRQRIPPPSRATYGVWLPPSRRPPPSLPARQARRSVHGLHPSRISPHRDRYPSQGPLPSCRYRLHPTFPEGDGDNLAGFMAFFPRRVRSVARITRMQTVDSLPGFPSSRACSRSSWRSL
jgi:hypothetical protein